MYFVAGMELRVSNGTCICVKFYLFLLLDFGYHSKHHWTELGKSNWIPLQFITRLDDLFWRDFFFHFNEECQLSIKNYLCKHRCLDILRMLAWQKDLMPSGIDAAIFAFKKGLLDEFHSRFMFRSFAVLLNSRICILKTKQCC